MEYTINKLAQMSGISTRTLRYYDQIGLICPMRMSSNGYRVYGQNEVDLLQQILFYRELGVSLEEIGHILKSHDYDKGKALEGHLSELLQRKNQIELLISNVIKTIGSLKGETIMSDKEKFDGFKQKMINDNETKYGKEIREKYGDDVIDASNAKVKSMSGEQWKRAEAFRTEYESLLKTAFEQGNPAIEVAQKACDLHRQWLCIFWKDGMYSKEAHKGIAEMYVTDKRFTAYYDKIAVGCANFLRDAINIYCK